MLRFHANFSIKTGFMLSLGIAFGLAAMAINASDLPIRPLVKTGPCPSGYNTSGNYCKPSHHARFAVPKYGSCPSGYSTSGNYCLASHHAKYAIPKSGSCPSGYSTSGSYCLSHQ